MRKKIQFFDSAVLAGALLGTLFSLPAIALGTGNEGAVVRAPNGAIFLISGGQRRGFPSRTIYFSNGYLFGDATPATTADLALPEGPLMSYRDGALVKDHTPTVYLISDGTKHPFSSADVFLGLGYSFASVLREPGTTLSRLLPTATIDSASSAHLPGTLINDSGTVYLITDAGRRGIPSLEAFYAARYQLQNIVATNTADLALPIEGQPSSPPVQVPQPAPTPTPSPTPGYGTGTSSNQPPSAPVISGVIATFPATTQNFTITAADPDNDRLTYIVDWGDATPKYTTLASSGTSSTVSHAWSFLGQYSIIVSVSDGKGGTSSSTYQVNVGNDTSAFGPAVTVLTPNGEETFAHLQPIKITWKRNWYPDQSQGKVDIYFSRAGINQSITTNILDSSYTWVPDNVSAATNYKIVVLSQGSPGGGGSVSDQSDNTFTIQP
jgi:hypothetical protein